MKKETTYAVTDDFHISISQIKKFIKSKQERAWKYILWIDESYTWEALFIWKLFHEYIEAIGKDPKLTEDKNTHAVFWDQIFNWIMDSVKKYVKENWSDLDWWERQLLQEKIIDKLKTLAVHFSHYDDSLIDQREFGGKKPVILDMDSKSLEFNLTYYVDAMDSCKNEIVDYKTVTFFTKIWDEKPPVRWWMSNRESYKLQAWLYMKMTGAHKTKFVEILKKEYKKYSREQSHQVIEIEMNRLFDSEMSKKYLPIIQEMIWLYQKYDIIRENNFDD